MDSCMALDTFIIIQLIVEDLVLSDHNSYFYYESSLIFELVALGRISSPRGYCIYISVLHTCTGASSSGFVFVLGFALRGHPRREAPPNARFPDDQVHVCVAVLKDFGQFVFERLFVRLFAALEDVSRFLVLW